MSEREPITGELRRVMNHTTMAGVPLVEIGEFEFGHRCDAIDAIHAGLECENAELRERLAVLDKRGDSMHDGGSITDELREFAKRWPCTDYRNKDMVAIADRIDAEHQKAIRELNNLADASVLLPVDADGEVIHVGDMMERGKTRGRVIALMLSNYPKKWGGELHWGVQLEGEHAPTALDLTFHHYHEPTVEDVLREFAEEMNENLGMYTGEAIDADEWRDADAKTVEKFAAKLRLAGDAE